MTTNEAILKLQLLLDKTGSPYFTTDEYLMFLNLAQLETLNRLVPDTLGGVANFELDENTYTSLQPITSRVAVTPVVGDTTSSVITVGGINSAITTSIGESATLFKLMSVSIGTTPVKYSRINDLSAKRSNSFKNAGYLYTAVGSAFRIYPPYTSEVIVHCLKNPRIMTAVNSPDWSDYVMNQVIQVAYQMATVATRDEAGLQLGTNTTIQSK